MTSRYTKFWTTIYKVTCALSLIAFPAALVVGLLWYFVSPILAGTMLTMFVISIPLAGKLSEPFGRLFFPNDRFDKPQPRFSIPAARRREGKFEEAIQGYTQLIEEHPDAAARAYIEMLDVLIVDLRDPERADRLYLEALENLSSKGDREHLAKVYRDIRSRIESDRHGLPDRAPIQLHPRS